MKVDFGNTDLVHARVAWEFRGFKICDIGISVFLAGEAARGLEAAPSG